MRGKGKTGGGGRREKGERRKVERRNVERRTLGGSTEVYAIDKCDYLYWQVVMCLVSSGRGWLSM